MANKSKVQSVEPDIADLVNGWLKSYGLDYKLEQASLNSEIESQVFKQIFMFSRSANHITQRIQLSLSISLMTATQEPTERKQV